MTVTLLTLAGLTAAVACVLHDARARGAFRFALVSLGLTLVAVLICKR